jgi:hypothetical protein
MSRLTAKNIRMLVAGAICLTGYHELFKVPLQIVNYVGWVSLVGIILSLVSLPMGIGLCFENRLALKLTQIYLWLVLVAGLIYTPLLFSGTLSLNRQFIIAELARTGSVVILLLLFYWSQYREREELQTAQQALAPNGEPAAASRRPPEDHPTASPADDVQ